MKEISALGRLLAALTLITISSSMLYSQVQLERLPYSGGVLMSRAIQQGRVHRAGSVEDLVNSVGFLTCTAPCVFAPVRASNAGSQPANEYPLAINRSNPLQLLTGANDYNCSNIQGFYASSDGGNTWNHTCTKGSGGEGDPVTGYDLVGNAFSEGIQSGSFKIFTSTDNGSTWSNP